MQTYEDFAERDGGTCWPGAPRFDDLEAFVGLAAQRGI